MANACRWNDMNHYKVLLAIEYKPERRTKSMLCSTLVWTGGLKQVQVRCRFGSGSPGGGAGGGGAGGGGCGGGNGVGRGSAPGGGGRAGGPPWGGPCGFGGPPDHVGGGGGFIVATPAGAAGSGARFGVAPFGSGGAFAAAGPSRASGTPGPVASPIALPSCVVLPKTSGRVPARRFRFAMISVSEAFVVSLIFANIASRWSFHFGSIRLIRMCSCISDSRTSSPVIGETAYFAGSYSCPPSVRL